MMVYVMSDDPTDSETRKLDSVAFAKNHLALGEVARGFVDRVNKLCQEPD